MLRTTYDSWLSPGLGRVKQLGVYEILESFDMLSGTSNGNEDKFEDGENKLAATPESEAPAATALLIHEWGHKKKAGKEQTKYLVHPLSSLLPLSAKDRRSSSSSLTGSFTSPFTSPTATGNSFPPSSWQMQVQNMGISIGTKRHSRSQSGSINRGSGGGLSPSNSIKSQSSSKSQTPAKVQNWRPRRASCSAVVGGTAGVWDSAATNGGPAHRIRGGGEGAGAASLRSSFCSSRSGSGPMSVHGHGHGHEQVQSQSQHTFHNDAQVTWAQSVNDKTQHRKNENVNSSGGGSHHSTSKSECSNLDPGTRRNSISKGILQCRCSILRRVKGLKTHGHDQIDEGYVLV